MLFFFLIFFFFLTKWNFVMCGVCVCIKACRIVSIAVRVDILVRPSQRISSPVPRRLRVRRTVKGIWTAHAWTWTWTSLLRLALCGRHRSISHIVKLEWWNNRTGRAIVSRLYGLKSLTSLTSLSRMKFHSPVRVLYEHIYDRIPHLITHIGRGAMDSVLVLEKLGYRPGDVCSPWKCNLPGLARCSRVVVRI